MASDDIQHQETPPPTLARRWARLSLSTRILIGLALGVAAGLFLGEVVAPLQLVADAYIRLMRMTVIPYVTVALITGLGQLELAQAPYRPPPEGERVIRPMRSRIPKWSIAATRRS